nr:GTP-binding protein [uncultured Celeribacter sp.]
MKGILALEGEDWPIAIHGVQHLVHAPTHMRHWPDGPRQSRQSRLVCAAGPEMGRAGGVGR